MSEPSFPSPEQIQQKLNEFLRSNFGDRASAFSTPAPDASGTPEPPIERPASPSFEFHYTPKDIKRHLDRFVIKQDEAKKVLSIAVCDHYNHAKHAAALREKEGPEADRRLEYAKQNVILIGPTGVGKTYLVKHVAELIGVPFVKADATKFSETGYVGGDVEDLVRELVHKANGDIALAEHGIIYIDEIDKIASAASSSGRDVSGRGVQTALLKLMEETEVPTRSQNDLQGQIQAMMEFQRKGKASRETVNTRHILFIVSGAFAKLPEIISRRVGSSRIGFNAEQPTIEEDHDLLAETTTSDLVDYGMEPEFIGRLPVRVACERLRAEDLFDILTKSEGSIIRQYERAFAAYGIAAQFEIPALRRIAEMASREKTGARALLTVCEKLLRSFKYELPGSGLQAFTIDEPLIDQPQKVLGDLLASGQTARMAALAQASRDFASRFGRDHGFTIRFDEETVALLARRAETESTGMQELCERLFKDYQFGLKLIQQNCGQAEFVIPAEAVGDPDGFLSRKVVESYRRSDDNTAESSTT